LQHRLQRFDDRINEGEKIDFILYTEGGSSIDECSIDGTLFCRAINEAKFAENSELPGILWHQGESDSQDEKIILCSK